MILQPINPNENADFGGPSEIVTESIESQGDSFLARASAKLKDANESTTTKRGRPPKEDATGEFANLLSSVIVIGFAFVTWPEEIKPNGDETGAVSLHLAKIIMRHVDISGKLTGDALDLIGIMAVSSAYYARIAPTLRVLREQKQAAQELDSNVLNRQAESMSYARPVDTREPVTPIQEASPLAKNWLDRQATAESV